MYKKTFDWRIKRPVYIWGSGEVARLTAKKLNSAGLKVDGFVVDERTELCRGGGYYPRRKFYPIPVVTQSSGDFWAVFI